MTLIEETNELWDSSFTLRTKSMEEGTSDFLPGHYLLRLQTFPYNVLSKLCVKHL